MRIKAPLSFNTEVSMIHGTPILSKVGIDKVGIMIYPQGRLFHQEELPISPISRK
jgi:hypothetical protein